MGVDPRYELDRKRVRRAFERAAPGYDSAAVLDAEVRERLLERLDLVSLAPQVVLDAGAATARGALALGRRYRDARILALDFAQAMLREAHERDGAQGGYWRLCADAASLPLQPASVDLIFCNLALHWCADPGSVLREFRRVLKPRGLLTLTTLGPDTLMELRQAWLAADPDGAVRVHAFYDLHDLGDALIDAGFAEPVMDVERITLTYREVADLVRDLRALGATCACNGRAHTLTGKARFESMQRAYERFRDADRLPATHEIVYAHAWGPVGLRGVTAADGKAVVPPADILRRRSR